eukprot:5698370-Pyramimonas_sp.AAC.2
MFSLVWRTDALVKMFNLNAEIAKGISDDSEDFKVLVLDRNTRDIISPLLKVNDLRKHGITLHLMVDSERQSIPDVPAVYFLEPSHDNVKKAIRDATTGLYDAFHFNFSGPLPRGLLELFAAEAVKADCLPKISKVFDQYLNFVTLDKGMFSLAQPKSYVCLNDPTAKDSDVEYYICNPLRVGFARSTVRSASVGTGKLVLFDSLLTTLLRLELTFDLLRCPRQAV